MQKVVKLKSYFRIIPRGIWLLGIVSLFTDASSELIHSILPIFLVSTLGASMTMVGVIEGIAEGGALVVKVFSGILSDMIGRRKWLVVLGYGFSACSKVLFPLANSFWWVFTGRVLDRVGKGVRDAPRDALVSEIASVKVRGASFGLRQALDTVGAFIGPLLAIILLYAFVDDIYKVLWIAIIPGFIAVGILIFGVKEPVRRTGRSKFSGLSLKKIGGLRRGYWKVVIIGFILTLARFSQAFLLLKGKASGLELVFVPLVMIVMNIFYALTSYPAGMISDKIDRKAILLIGIVFLFIGDLVLGFGENLWFVFIGAGFWGLHMGFSEGILAAMVADSVIKGLRGTAFGVYNFIGGLGMFVSSFVAGLLWDYYGSNITFYVGALFSILAFGAVILVKNRVLERD